ncbi:MAG: hypothetical protein HQM15_03405 [Deltaproteobacteria bacterium]|nr:hypothetical protein [Deltaproteobacteria bacterium]
MVKNFSRTFRVSILLFIISLFPVYKHAIYSLWAFLVSPYDLIFPTLLEILYWILLVILLPLSFYFSIQYNRHKTHKQKYDAIPMTLNLIALIVLFMPFEEQFTNLNYRVFSKNRQSAITYIDKNRNLFDKLNQSIMLPFSDFGYVSAGNKITLTSKGNGSYVVYFPDYKTKFRSYAYLYVPTRENCSQYSDLKTIYYNEHWCYIGSEVKP